MLVRQHLLALLVVAYICSAFLPGLGIRLREPITVSASVSMIYLLLAILLFTLGLSIPREKLPTAFLELKWVAVFVLLRLVACGLLLIACRLVQATNGIPALGIAVVLAAPTAASSAGWSMQWQAKESVTIALIVGSTLAVTATAPWAFSMGTSVAPARDRRTYGESSRWFPGRLCTSLGCSTGTCWNCRTFDRAGDRKTITSPWTCNKSLCSVVAQLFERIHQPTDDFLRDHSYSRGDRRLLLYFGVLTSWADDECACPMVRNRPA